MKNRHHVGAITELLSRVNTNADHAHERTLENIARPLKNSAEAIMSLHDNEDPTQTRARHEQRFMGAAKKIGEQRKAVFEKAQEAYRAGLLEIDKRIATKVSLKVDDKYAQEIRQHYRTLKPADQLALLNQLARDNDGPSLAAIIGVPKVLTGLSQEMQQRFQQQILDINAPDLVAEQAALHEAFEKVLAITDVARDLAKEYSDPVRLSEIESRVTASNVAQAAFVEATTTKES